MKGFTLIELIIVVAILCIMLAIAYAGIKSAFFDEPKQTYVEQGVEMPDDIGVTTACVNGLWVKTEPGKKDQLLLQNGEPVSCKDQ